MSGQRNRSWLLAAAMVAVGLASGCGDDKGRAEPPPVTLERVELSANASSIAKGTTTQLSATAIYSNSSKVDVSAQAAWATSNGTVLTMASKAVAKGLGVGKAEVSATFEGKVGTTAIEVTKAAVKQLAITPPEATLAKGMQATLAATAVMTDDTTQDVTRDAQWSESSKGAVAAVLEPGKLDARGEGKVTVSAAIQGKSASAELTVTPKQLVALALEPASGSVPVGLTLEMKAVGTYTDDSTEDLTTVVKWCSSKEQFAAVSNEPGTEGVLRALAEGKTQVCAIEKCTGITATADVTVTRAIATSITIVPAAASVPKGDSLAFAASAVFSDGSTRNVTADAVWSSSDEDVATIVNAAAESGLATGRGLGKALIKAKVAGSAAEGTAELEVTAAVLRAIEISPANGSIAKGLSLAFTARGIYSDQSDRDVTGQVTWSASPAGIVSVSNAAVDKGAAVALAKGPAKVGALDPATKVAAETAFTVTDALPVSIEIQPAEASIPHGNTQAFRATVAFTDNTKRDDLAFTWSSSNTAVATISGGVAKGAGEGIAEIGVALPGTDLRTKAQLTVTEEVLKSVRIEPASYAMPKGLTKALKAMGTFTDNVERDATAMVTWTSSKPEVAAVANGSAAGLVEALYVGEADITVVDPTNASVKASARVTVTREELVAIQVTPPKPVLPLGLRQQFTATGVYTDKSTQDLTATVLWSSDAEAVSVENSDGKEGLASTWKVGKAVVTATYPGTLKSGSALLEVSPATVARIDVTPHEASIAKGREAAFVARAVYTNGWYLDSAAAVWSSSNQAVFPIGASSGKAKGEAEGTATITAALAGTDITGKATLKVTPKVLDEIRVSAAQAKIPKGNSEQLSALAVYSDKSTDDFTSVVKWTSVPAGIAPVSAAGVAFGQALGKVEITATDEASGVASAPFAFEVSEAKLLRIALEPAAASVPMGRTLSIKAFGTYTDTTGAPLNITGLASWSSSDATKATVLGGVVTGVAKAAAVTITASYQGQQASVDVEITDAVLDHLVLSPADVVRPRGRTVQYAATGVMSAGPNQDRYAVTWKSSDESVVYIDAKGLATAKGVGVATITAEDPATHIQATARFEVTWAVLERIDVTPASPRVPLGLHQQFTAKGTYSDGSWEDLTATATWSSSDEEYATISNAIGAIHGGEATTRAPASGLPAAGKAVTITAQFPGSAIKGSAVLTVTPAILVSIQVSTPDPAVAVGREPQFVAEGLFSDGGRPIPLTDVTWESSDASVLSVGTDGKATALAVGGPVVVSAKRAGIDGSWIVGEAEVRVTAAELDDLSIAPAAATVPQGKTVSFRVTGEYSDHTLPSIEAELDWEVVPGGAGSVEMVLGDDGKCHGEFKGGASTGDVKVRATVPDSMRPVIPGMSIEAVITVTDAVVESIRIEAVDPLDASVPKGLGARFAAWAEYSYGPDQDVTADPGTTWEAIAGTGAASHVGAGLFQGDAEGTVTVRASFAGKAGEATLTVTEHQLLSIRIDPAAWTLPKGLTKELTAYGMFTDGEHVITNDVTWTTSDDDVYVWNRPAAAGEPLAGTVKGMNVTALPVTIEAAMPRSAVAPGTASITVLAARLVGLEILPGPDQGLPAGYDQQYVALGDYTDGLLRDVTESVLWSSSDLAVVQVSNAAGERGLAHTAAAGPATITARYVDPMAEPPIDVADASTLHVSEAIPTALVVDPAITLLVPAATCVADAFTVRATYSNGSSLLATDVVASSVFDADPAGDPVTLGDAADANDLCGVAAGVATLRVEWAYKAGLPPLAVDTQVIVF